VEPALASTAIQARRLSAVTIGSAMKGPMGNRASVVVMSIHAL